MAYCTNCGANLNGAFCTNCGTPAQAASGPAPAASQSYGAPAGAPIPPAPMAPVPMAPPQRKTSPLVWVLVALGTLVLVGVVAAMGIGLFVAHKVRQAGIDPELLRSNPGYAAVKVLVNAHPELEEVRHDDGRGTITVRDRRTGKETTLNFDDIRHGHFSITTDSDNGGTANVDIGGNGSVKLPSWVPEYPGSTGHASFSLRANDSNEGEGGSYAFTTSDPASSVLSFYRNEASRRGMREDTNTTSSEGGVFTARDEERSFTVLVGRNGSETSVNVTYGVKR